MEVRRSPKSTCVDVDVRGYVANFTDDFGCASQGQLGQKTGLTRRKNWSKMPPPRARGGAHFPPVGDTSQCGKIFNLTSLVLPSCGKTDENGDTDA